MFTPGTGDVKLSIVIGEFRTIIVPSHHFDEEQFFSVKLKLVESLPLEGEVNISFDALGDSPDMVSLDAIIFIPVDKKYTDSPSARYVHLTNRYEDFGRLIGLWNLYNNDGKYIVFFIIRCYPVWILINILFLSIFTWTPGGLLFHLRTVTLKGERPGFTRAVLRGLAAFVGWFTFGYAWFKPLISHDERTWSDSWSQTRLIILE